MKQSFIGGGDYGYYINPVHQERINIICMCPGCPPIAIVLDKNVLIIILSIVEKATRHLSSGVHIDLVIKVTYLTDVALRSFHDEESGITVLAKS